MQTCLPLSRIQRLIGRRMLSSKRTKPCFYLERKADVTELLAMRHGLSKVLGVKVTSNAFLIHALALAAKAHPLMVGRLVVQGSTTVISIARNVNVGFAVNTAQGVVVPVVKEAQNRSLAEIAAEEKRLTARARSNRLTLPDIEDETIALSNLGAYDIDSFVGIVPPPTSTILAVGKVEAAAVPLNARVAVRKMMSLSLAVDRRVIHEQYAARFLDLLAERLQEPERLI